MVSVATEYMFNCQYSGRPSSESSEVHDDRIHDEDAQHKRQCRDYITSRIGAGPQPVLETLKYQVSNLDMFLADFTVVCIYY